MTIKVVPPLIVWKEVLIKVLLYRETRQKGRAFRRQTTMKANLPLLNGEDAPIESTLSNQRFPLFISPNHQEPDNLVQ
jgi:hypothetical protein